MSTEKTKYLASALANTLSVTPSTLRRWCLLMEDAGYAFERNERDQRLFHDHDRKTFVEMKKMMKAGKTIDECVHAVASGSQALGWTDQKTPTTTGNLVLSKDELSELICASVQEAVNAEREGMFEAFERRMERRDRELLQRLSETQTARLESAQAEQAPEKKSLFRRIFG